MKPLGKRLLFLAASLLLPGLAAAGQKPEPVPDAQSKPGETLTERLDRTDSVIKPPPVDEPMHIEPPPIGSDMPIIKPPAPPQPPESAKPK